MNDAEYSQASSERQALRGNDSSYLGNINRIYAILRAAGDQEPAEDFVDLLAALTGGEGPADQEAADEAVRKFTSPNVLLGIGD